MCSFTESLKKANISAEIANDIEDELEKKFVARDPFPPIKWDKKVMMPMLQEQFKTSERLESLRIEMNSRFESLESQMNSRFESLVSQMDARFESLESQMDARFESLDSRMDARFHSIDDRFRVFTWMQGILIMMIFAIFSKLYLNL